MPRVQGTCNRPCCSYKGQACPPNTGLDPAFDLYPSHKPSTICSKYIFERPKLTPIAAV
ncbi:unnamed protein product [Chondrus crispus]|uniref:Uncharacterized protein n=1 Tax=Chondrus crispus TaxID=2769 RepID=R7Q4Z7_CHOCR|nr:unnamed protein product [Chondrus crispus]CDF32510.1 unnamed protein product [Chondrus crispus]|eukprot:XP_005712175.1 unnamed protein product [Chondrus crispus]